MNPGDIVRVRDADVFIASFANKVRDRDAIVRWVGPTVGGMNKGLAGITFQKRNGRGKEFMELISIRDLIVIRSASQDSGAGDV